MYANSFQAKTTTQKGNVGERIVREYLAQKGFVVYQTNCTEHAHGFDMLAMRNKEQMIVVEVKAKAKRDCCPDTGINLKHYNEYKAIQAKHNLPIFLVFVDEKLGEVYGDWLSALEADHSMFRNDTYPYVRPHGRNGEPIIYFYQPNMRKLATLTQDEIIELKQLTTGKNTYTK